MIHAIYSLILRLHPRGFRDRFGPEMQATFEHALADGWGARLITDGLLSLARQWLNVLDGSAGARRALLSEGVRAP